MDWSYAADAYLASHHLYWVGARASDAEHFYNKLAGVIALYGRNRPDDGTPLYSYSETSGVRGDNNVISDEANRYFRETIIRICEEDPDAAFMFYNPCWIRDIGGLDAYTDRFIGVNPMPLIEKYGSKFVTFEALRSRVNMLPARLLPAGQCTLDGLKEALGPAPFGYIVQGEYSSGGCQTRIVAHPADETALPDAAYLVSAYYRHSTSVNVHAVIFKNDILLFPASVQILREEDRHLIYKGADYAAYRHVDAAHRKIFEKNARKVCEVMQAEGYRGVVGIDGIIYGDTAAVVEVNTRFQGSTAALNEGLFANGMPLLQTFHLAAFLTDGCDAQAALDALSIGFSSYSYSYIQPADHAAAILRQAPEDPNVVRVDADGYRGEATDAPGVYLFRLIFNCNICCNNYGEEVWVHENVCEPDLFLYTQVLRKDPLALKIALITIGVRIEPATERFLLENGGIREGNNNSVDILLLDMVINAPVDVRFVRLSPFEIRLTGEQTLGLFYYGRYIDAVSLWKTDPLCRKKTKSGIPYADVAYLSTDRLRVHMTNKCVYKKNNLSCKFCNINTDCDAKLIPLEDIREVVSAYLQLPELRHLLVGGQSTDEQTGKGRVVEIIRLIRSLTDKDIYVMTLPFTKQTILEMKQAGMTELACNIEVHDDRLAELYMPGKGAIPRDYYYDILGYAAKLYPERSDAVRTAFIVGLEPDASFMEGFRRCLENGIQPILSVFRPLPDTEMEFMMSPPCMALYELFLACEGLCRAYRTALGPTCTYCQNNTLALPGPVADRYFK